VPSHSGTNFRDRWIFHFTHVDNLAPIVAQGALTCDRRAREGQTRVEVGDVAIKEFRRSRAVPVGPGGCVGDYVVLLRPALADALPHRL
jgi:hypothetical protein